MQSHLQGHLAASGASGEAPVASDYWSDPALHFIICKPSIFAMHCIPNETWLLEQQQRYGPIGRPRLYPAPRGRFALCLLSPELLWRLANFAAAGSLQTDVLAFTAPFHSLSREEGLTPISRLSSLPLRCIQLKAERLVAIAAQESDVPPSERGDLAKLFMATAQKFMSAISFTELKDGLRPSTAFAPSRLKAWLDDSPLPDQTVGTFVALLCQLYALQLPQVALEIFFPSLSASFILALSCKDDYKALKHRLSFVKSAMVDLDGIWAGIQFALSSHRVTTSNIYHNFLMVDAVFNRLHFLTSQLFMAEREPQYKCPDWSVTASRSIKCRHPMLLPPLLERNFNHIRGPFRPWCIQSYYVTMAGRL